MTLTPEMDAKIAATRAALRKLKTDRGCDDVALQLLIGYVEIVATQAGPDGRGDLRAFFTAFCDACDAGAATLTAEELAIARANRAPSKVVA